MKKNEIKGYILLAVLFSVFSVITFAIPFVKTGTFWVAYAFGVLAIGFQIYAFKNAFHGTEEAKSKIYGFPIAKVAIYYLLIQLIISIAGLLLAKYCPVWIILIASVLALGFAVTGCITADIMREEVVRQDVQLKKDVSNMRNMQSLMNTILNQNTILESKVILEKLSEEFRYSDPVTSDQTREIEDELLGKLKELQKSVLEQNPEIDDEYWQSDYGAFS